MPRPSSNPRLGREIFAFALAGVLVLLILLFAARDRGAERDAAGPDEPGNGRPVPEAGVHP